MALIVQKFGGSSVANAERVAHVAGIIADTYRKGNQVVVVVSAQGKTTDELIAKAKEINPNPSKRELDALMATGELVSMSLMAMALDRLGVPGQVALRLAGRGAYRQHPRGFPGQAHRGGAPAQRAGQGQCGDRGRFSGRQ